MSCPANLYTNSDLFVTLTIEDATFEITDVKDLIVVLQLKAGGTLTKTYSLAGGQITKNGNELILHIGKTDITTKGQYKLKITMIDQSDNSHALTPCASVGVKKDCLEFVDQ